MADDPARSSLSGVQGIETRVRDAISQLVLASIDDLAVEGMCLLADLRLAKTDDPGTPMRTQIVTRMASWHTRALSALLSKGVV